MALTCLGATTTKVLGERGGTRTSTWPDLTTSVYPATRRWGDSCSGWGVGKTRSTAPGRAITRGPPGMDHSAPSGPAVDPLPSVVAAPPDRVGRLRLADSAETTAAASTNANPTRCGLA